MRILKSHPLLKLVNSYIIDASQPSNISYLWNFGSLLALCLGIQIITGLFLAMHYNPSVLEAFNSVEHIMRDVNNGWLIRYLHSNTASAFFFLVYLHIGRGLYYGSYRAPRTLVWVLGIIIFLLMIVTGFLGFFSIAQNDFNSITTTTTKTIITTNYDKPIIASHTSAFITIYALKKIFTIVTTILLIFFLLLLFIVSICFDELNENYFNNKVDSSKSLESNNTELDIKTKSDVKNPVSNSFDDSVSDYVDLKLSEVSEKNNKDSNYKPDISLPDKSDASSNKDFFEFDMEYYKIQNLEAFINNGQINIEYLKEGEMPIRPSFIKYLLDHISEVILPNNLSEIEEQERMQKIITDYKANLNENREEWLDTRTNIRDYNLTSNINDSPTSTDFSDAAYEKLIRAISSGREVSIYDSISMIDKYPESVSSKGDWSKLEPLTASVEGNNISVDNKPRQIIIISDRNSSGQSLLPFPKFGEVSERPSTDNVAALAQWNKEVAIQKAWVRNYPSFPEHYEQMKGATDQVNNEAWWLQQQDNNLQWNRPTDEGEEPYYLEELFGNKAYPESSESQSASSLGSRTKGDGLLRNNKFEQSGPSKKYYSTSSKIPNPAPEKSELLIEFIKSKNLKPVFVYENLGDDFIKKKLIRETKGLSGIYLILNKVTLDYYIGSAATNKFNTRFSNHLINFHGSKLLKNAVRKYKLSSFAFLVLELFPEIVTKENNKDLLDLEDYYLKSLLPNYNILTEAGSSFGYKHSEITRIKMKTNYSEERKLLIGNLNKGKKFSLETIELMREKALNRNNIIYSEKGIANMKKSSKAIIVYNLDRTKYGEFPSIVETAKALNCSVKTVSRSLSTPKNLLKKRWIVNYVK
jgi:group I intron endonuclease